MARCSLGVMQHLQNVILQCKGSRCAEHSIFYFEILCWKLSSQSKFWYFQSFSWKVIPPMDSMALRAKYSRVSCPEGVCCLMRVWLLVHQEQGCWCIKTRAHYCIISTIYFTSNKSITIGSASSITFDVSSLWHGESKQTFYAKANDRRLSKHCSYKKAKDKRWVHHGSS